MTTKIIIEIAGGRVSAVYSQGPIPAALHVSVVDLDAAQVGEATREEDFAIESLSDASDIVKECVAP